MRHLGGHRVDGRLYLITRNEREGEKDYKMKDKDIEDKVHVHLDLLTFVEAVRSREELGLLSSLCKST